MRLCRFDDGDGPRAGFYYDDFVILLSDAARICGEVSGHAIDLPDSDDLLPLLPPDGKYFDAVSLVYQWLEETGNDEHLRKPVSDTRLLVPIPRPPKLFLLAGNYAAHIEEGGGIAAEREDTFPYVFMKPPSTTLTDPNSPVIIPKVSPDHIDWELELGVVIGRGGKHIAESDALDHVAGYTVFNDISDRKFRPNPGRKERERDKFFDWQHGKWHDGSCPCGPCIASAASLPDPQNLEMKLSVNGSIRQDASTAQQIFPVAAVIEFLSRFVTLEPGDMISTGTAAGVGNTSKTYLKADDKIDAWIENIGTLHSTVENEA